LHRVVRVWHNQAILSETEFELNGSLGEIGRLVEHVDRFCETAGLDGDAGFELNLVLEELFTNAVRHGGCQGMEKAVRIRLQPLENRAVAIEFHDRGVPFDPTAAPAPDLEAALEKRGGGGLGIHLVRQLVRDLRYRREEDWNHLTMRREAKHEAKSL